MYRPDIDWSTIPQPRDDGGARHLTGRRLPPVTLPGSDGVAHGLADRAGITVLFTFPLAGRLDAPLPHDWDCLPGARGCVPQLCAYRRHFEALRNWKVRSVFGISTQTRDYQAETVRRLDLPFVLLSDADHHLMRCAAAAHVQSGGRAAVKAADDDRDGRPHRAGVLSGVSAGPGSASGHRLAGPARARLRAARRLTPGPGKEARTRLS